MTSKLEASEMEDESRELRMRHEDSSVIAQKYPGPFLQRICVRSHTHTHTHTHTGTQS